LSYIVHVDCCGLSTIVIKKIIIIIIIQCKVALRKQEAQLLQGDRATRKPAKDS